jgi:hypothetical protein
MSGRLNQEAVYVRVGLCVAPNSFGYCQRTAPCKDVCAYERDNPAVTTISNNCGETHPLECQCTICWERVQGLRP